MLQSHENAATDGQRHCGEVSPFGAMQKHINPERLCVCVLPLVNRVKPEIGRSRGFTGRCASHTGK